MGEGKGGIPGWLYASCGCLLILGLVVVGIGIFGALEVKNMVEELEDPVTRQRKALEILGTDELPQGYYAAVGLDLPFIMKMAVLTDEQGVDGSGKGSGESTTGSSADSFEDSLENGFRSLDRFEDIDGDHAFFYMFFKVKADEDDKKVFERASRGREELASGELVLADQTIRYRSHRGDSKRRRDKPAGVFTTLEIVCPDGKDRFALWFVAVEEEQTDLTGTPADEQAIGEFVGHFDLCGSAG